MKNIILIKPEEHYIASYWQAFDIIAKEGKYLASNEAFSLESTENFIKESIKNSYPHLFAIDVVQDICVGWCDVIPKTATVGYLGMGLLAEYRNVGIGKKMLHQIIKLCRVYGYREIQLDVRKSNQRAIHVYEQVGFVQTTIVAESFVWHEKLVSESVVQMSLAL